MPTTFSSLPDLVVSEILRACRPEDLQNMIFVSRQCHGAFQSYPGQVIRQSVKSVIPPMLWQEFCAAHYLMTNLGADTNKSFARAQIKQDFLRRYFSASPNFEISPKLEDATAAHKLHSAISFFINDFIEKVVAEIGRMCRLPPGTDLWKATPDRHGASSPTKYDLSSTEYFRLYRAFLRFEIYSQLFKPRPHRPLPLSWETGKTQFDIFLSELEPWEVEEMTCVYQYFGDYIKDTLENMDEAFEEKIRDLFDKGIAVREPAPDLGPQVYMSRSPLVLYSQLHQRYHSVLHVGTIVSSGLMYMLAFARSDEMARRIAIRTVPVTTTAFLSSALSWSQLRILPLPSPNSGIRDAACRCSPAVHQVVECPLVANEGHFRRACDPITYFCVEHEWHISHKAVGYVFWDAARLDCPDTRSAFTESGRRLDYRPRETAFPRYRVSPELRLGPIMLPYGTFKELSEEFGIIR